MPGENFLDKYLVKLGFDVKTDGISSFFSMVDEGKRKISYFSRNTKYALVDTITTFVGLAAKAAETSLDFTTSIANFDKQMELEARKMWMSKDAFMAINEAVQTLGYSMDEIGTIALDPELSSQFRQLYSMSQDFQGDYSGIAESLRTMREFEFQLKKLSLIGSYFLKTFGAGLVRYFEGPLGQANSSISDIVEKLRKDLPRYVDVAVKKVAPFISGMITKGRQLVDLAKKIYEYFSGNPEALSRTLRLIALIFTALNPVKGLALFIFSKINEYLSDINDESVDMEEKWGGVEKLVKSVANFVDAIYNSVVNLVDWLNKNGWLDKAASVFDWLSDLISGDFSRLGFNKPREDMTKAEKLGTDVSNGIKGWYEMLSTGFESASEVINTFASKKAGNYKSFAISENKVSPEFLKLLRDMGFSGLSDFAKTDYYRQIMDQVTNNVDNSNKTVQITNNYNGVNGSDAKKLSEAQVEQFNVALANMSF